jgi:hypothetical protein
VQALLLYNIGDKEMTAGEHARLLPGLNVSYNLKKLVELGFLDHQRCARSPLGPHPPHRAGPGIVAPSTRSISCVKTVEQVGGISNEEFATLNKSPPSRAVLIDQIPYRL